MTPLEVLRSARETLSIPERWTKGASAKNERGQKTWSYAPDAVCWCLYGSILRLQAPASVEIDALTLLSDIIGGSIAFFNDARATTHADVLRVLDAAIKVGDIGQRT